MCFFVENIINFSKGDVTRQWRTADQNFLNFMQFLGKIWQICMLAPPPTRTPGSAPAREGVCVWGGGWKPQQFFLEILPLA